MRLSSTLKSSAPWIFFALFLGVVWALNASYWFSSDDCYYGCVQRPGVVFEGARAHIGNWSNLWREMLADWYRPVVHFFARLFAGILGKGAFNIANTGMMGALLLLLHRLAFGRWRLEARQTPWMILLVFCILCKGESYLWCAGSVNYLWAGTATLGFYLMWERLSAGAVRGWQLGVMALAAIFCGWVQEAFSVPMCFGLGLYALYHLRALTLRKVIVGSAYGLGALALVYVSSRRLQTVEAFSVMGLVMTLCKIAVAAKGVWLLGALALCSRAARQRLRQEGEALAVIAGSLLMIAAVGFNGERSIWCANLFAILLVLKVWRAPRAFCLTAGAGLMALWAVVLTLAWRIGAAFEEFHALYLSNPAAVTCHERVACGPFARFFHQSIYTWQPYGHACVFADYYGRTESPIALSRELYQSLYLAGDFCSERTRLPIPGQFYSTPTANAIVMPLESGDCRDWSAARVAVKYDFAPGFAARVRRELALRRNPPVDPQDKPLRLDTSHGTFLLIPKLPGCDSEIRAVQLSL